MGGWVGGGGSGWVGGGGRAGRWVHSHGHCYGPFSLYRVAAVRCPMVRGVQPPTAYQRSHVCARTCVPPTCCSKVISYLALSASFTHAHASISHAPPCIPTQINGLLLVHLPDGPTAHFRLSNLKLGADIKVCGRSGRRGS